MGLCGMFCLGSFSQQISWRTEVQECLLVPSNATGLEHAQWGPRGPFQLTYDIPIRYPAKSVTQFLCEDLQKNGWQAQTGCSEPATWWVTNIKTPTKSYPQYRWQGNFTNEKNDTATYLLDYTYAKDQDYLKTVHVNASCSLHPVEIPVRQQPESRSLVDKIDAKTLRFVLTFFFFLLLSSVWWVLTGIAFWLVFFCMENRRRVPSQTIRKFTPDNSKERGAADDTYNIWR